MRIALLTDGVHPLVIGGMQKHSLFLARYLARLGVQVDLYHLLPPDADPQAALPWEEEEQPFIREIRIPFVDQGRLPGHYIRACHAYSQLVLSELLPNLAQTDFIYAQGFSAWALLQARKKGLACPSICVNFHGLEMFQLAANWRERLRQQLFRAPVRFHLREADFLQSLGGKLTDILRQEGVSEERIWEIPIGMEESWMRDQVPERKGPCKFIFVGRYERRKGIEELHQVVKELLGKAKFQLSFIGPIPAEHQLSSDQIHYWGLVKDSTRIQEILDEADVLICPSYAEGMPTVILEAMSRACAIIATDVGATREEVSPENGWLIPAASQAALAEAIQAAINLPRTILHQKQAASLGRVRKDFAWPAVADRSLAHIQRVLPVQIIEKGM